MHDLTVTWLDGARETYSGALFFSAEGGCLLISYEKEAYGFPLSNLRCWKVEGA